MQLVLILRRGNSRNKTGGNREMLQGQILMSQVRASAGGRGDGAVRSLAKTGNDWLKRL